MLSPQALIKGLVSRALPSINFDSLNTDVALRLGRYGEAYNQPLVRKAHNLADEGSYFTANNGQTGLAEANNTAFTATAPFLVIFNGNAAGGPNVYVDYLALVTTAAGSAASGLTAIQAAAVIDNGNRLGSGGTTLTLNNVNLNSGLTAPNVVVTAGTPTATAASPAARMVCGLRTLRPTVSATVADVVGEMKLLNFGGVEGATGSCTIANANVLPQAFPPIVIGPNQSFLFYVWQATGATNVVANYAPEIGLWVR
jgi:hypothetical protein